MARRKVQLPTWNISSEQVVDKDFLNSVFPEISQGELVINVKSGNTIITTLDENDNVVNFESSVIIDEKINEVKESIKELENEWGHQGPMGPQGADGADGANGADGAQGPQGADGADGANGADGAQGPQGADGAQGPQGADGAQGPQGADGAQGPQGADGANGADGAQGPKGADGKDGTSVTILGTKVSESELPMEGNSNGDGYIINGHLYVWDGDSWNDVGEIKGPQGPQGPKGADGTDGVNGVNGADGAQGPQGADGANGIDGAQGADGTQGPQGVSGADGKDGADGAQGPQGAAGADGKDGTSVTILGSKTDENELPMDGNSNGDGYIIEGYLYVWSGDKWNNVGEIKGPQGDKGETGADGAQGPQGADGAQGPQGADGAQGPQGADGAQGPQGADGANGVDGAQGPQGAAGADGKDGADGADGAQGPQGADGAQGPQGPKGTDLTSGAYLPISGGTMSGPIIHTGREEAGGAIVLDGDGDKSGIFFPNTTKGQQIVAAGGSIVFLNSDKITPVVGYFTNAVRDVDNNVITATYLPKSGGTMSGILNFSGGDTLYSFGVNSTDSALTISTTQANPLYGYISSANTADSAATADVAEYAHKITDKQPKGIGIVDKSGMTVSFAGISVGPVVAPYATSAATSVSATTAFSIYGEEDDVSKIYLVGFKPTSSEGYTDPMIETLRYASLVYMENGNIFSESDERLKDFYGDIDCDLEKIAKLPKKYFKYKNNDITHIGTSAQAVKELYPEIVSETKEGKLAVAYDKLSIIALSAVDKLYEENKELKERLKRIEEHLDL